MPEADNENCLGDDCTSCNSGTFTATITEVGTGDIELDGGSDSGSSPGDSLSTLQIESGHFLRFE